MENHPKKHYIKFKSIMKTIFSIIFLNLFILSISCSNIIYDSSGNKILRGFPYYILPLLRGSGGGLTLTQSTKDMCPLNVTQEPFEVNHGVPFIFNPIVLEEDIIRGAYPISIEADVTNPCKGSKIWKVTSAKVAKNDDDGLLPRLNDNKKKDHDDKKFVDIEIVTTGGEFNKLESCFQFVENDSMPGLQSYQIQYCPFKCGSSSVGGGCYNVGIISNVDGKGYLGRTDGIFPVVFTNSFGTFSSRSSKVSMFSKLSTKVSKFSRVEK